MPAQNLNTYRHDITGELRRATAAPSFLWEQVPDNPKERRAVSLPSPYGNWAQLRQQPPTPRVKDLTQRVSKTEDL